MITNTMTCPKCQTEMRLHDNLPDGLQLVKAVYTCPNCQTNRLSFGDSVPNPYAAPNQDDMLAQLRRDQAERRANRTHEESMYLATLDFIHHSGASYADKQAWASAYLETFPRRYSAMVIQDALDASNPAYIGMAKHIVCGRVFFANREYLEVETDTMHLRVEVWLDAAAGLSYHIAYTVGAECSNSIGIDGAIVHQGQGLPMRQLYEKGLNALLDKLGILPF